MKVPPDQPTVRDLPEMGRTSPPPSRFRPAAVLFSLCLALAIVASIYYVVGRRLPWKKVDVLALSLREPSGIVFHPGRGTLFVVGDEGTIGEITLEGLVARKRLLAGADFEGITVDPATGLLYALIEKENAIIELDADRLDTRRRFEIDGRYNGQTLIPPGAEGLEGIAFVPDSSHAEGGRFFIVNRGPAARGGHVRPGDSFLAELAVPLRSSAADKADATIVAAVGCSLGDLSDLTWAAPLGQLVAISDQFDTYVELGPDGAERSRLWLAGQTQEGIAFGPNGSVYVAQDSGGILRVRPR